MKYHNTCEYCKGLFWTKDPVKNPTSNGTLQLSIIDSNSLKSFYVRLQTQISKEEYSVSRTLTPIKFEWERIIKNSNYLGRLLNKIKISFLRLLKVIFNNQRKK